MSGDESDAFLCTFEDLGTDVIPKVTLNFFPKIHFIPRKFIPKSKITLDHARKCLIPGEDVSAKKNLKDLNETKKNGKEWFKNKVSKILIIQI